MQCGQGKPFTVTSTNSKMGSVAVRSYEKGGVVTKPTLKDDKNDTGVTTYDKLPRGQKEEIDNRRRAAVKAAEDKPKRRMGDAVADIAALSPIVAVHKIATAQAVKRQLMLQKIAPSTKT
jgi:hypothetical protein